MYCKVINDVGTCIRYKTEGEICNSSEGAPHVISDFTVPKEEMKQKENVLNIIVLTVENRIKQDIQFYVNQDKPMKKTEIKYVTK